MGNNAERWLVTECRSLRLHSAAVAGARLDAKLLVSERRAGESVDESVDVSVQSVVAKDGKDLGLKFVADFPCNKLQFIVIYLLLFP